MTTKRKRGIVSGFLTVIGIVMLALSIAYQAYYYPWGALLSSLGLSDAQELSDPAPIPVSVQSIESSFTVQQGVPEPSALGSFFAARPALDITAIGSIKLPAIGISENLVEGGGDELFYGVGHIPGSALPGDAGNCVLAGHRNYYIMHPFRHLDKLEMGDEVIISYNNIKFRYVVYDSFVVEPQDTDVLAPQEGEEQMLTLVTCTPVLNPTKRLIVWCRPAGI